VVFLRPDPKVAGYLFTTEQKIAMGRETVARRNKFFFVPIVSFVFLVLAMRASFLGPTIFSLRAPIWWVIAAYGVVLFLTRNLSISRCPGCNHYLGGRNHYARVCVWCGVPITRLGLRDVERHAHTR